MSWFVLNPPPEVRIVSFFITARLANQDNRVAFIDSLMEQLLALLGESMPPFMPDSSREAHLLGLLADAAEACRVRGESFVLLVDGLDEDRSVHTGADAHSIAALLPIRPPAGMRVVVSGRPSPPIPADVAAHHPLRNENIVRSLAASSKAAAIRVEMEREIKTILQANDADTGQELLGLLSAAGGGLSAADLAELSECPQWEVEDHLRTVTGRSFSRRGSHYQPGEAPDVYLLGHEDLQFTALEVLAERVDSYRERIHAWADQYRIRRWPSNTPEYLLRGYYGMLAATGDLTQMVSCATDPARHDRMLDVSRGDAAALAEISTAQDIIVTQHHPDLAAMVRLAIHRDHLTDRNLNIPTDLPAVWARLGQINRAESIAGSISRDDRRQSALRSVADSAARAGYLDRAVSIVGSIIEPYNQACALRSVAEAAARAGQLDRAETIVRSITDPADRTPALTSIADIAASLGRHDYATELLQSAETAARSITYPRQQRSALTQVSNAVARAGHFDRAETIARSIADPTTQAQALASVAQAAGSAGQFDRSTELLQRAETTARSIGAPGLQRLALGSVACAAAASGLVDRAMELLRHADELHDRADTLTPWSPSGDHDHVMVAALAASAGEVDSAEAIARSFADPATQAQALASVAGATARAGHFDHAETIARSITDPNQRAQALSSVAGATARAGHFDLAETIARSITYIDYQSQALASVAKAAGRAGHLDLAETIARSITDPDRQACALVSVAEAAADAGHVDQATQLLERAETIARAIRYPVSRAQALADLAEAAARGGLSDRAETIADSITEPALRARALSSMAEAAARAGHLNRAETVAGSIANAFVQAQALSSVAEAAARAGQFDRAETIVQAIRFPHQLAQALSSIAAVAADMGRLDRCTEFLDRAMELLDRAQTAVGVATFLIFPEWVKTLTLAAKAAAGAGQFDRAEIIVGSITDPDRCAQALALVAEAAARAGQFDRAEAIVGSITDPDRCAQALALIAKAAARGGRFDRCTEFLDRATELLDRAEPVTYSPREDKHAMAQTSVAWSAACAGQLDRAETLAGSITNDLQRIDALTWVAEAAANAGQLDRAEIIADSITNPFMHALALRTIARNADLARQARAIAQLLKVSHWYISKSLIETEPAALAEILAGLNATSQA